MTQLYPMRACLAIILQGQRIPALTAPAKVTLLFGGGWMVAGG